MEWVIGVVVYFIGAFATSGVIKYNSDPRSNCYCKKGEPGHSYDKCPLNALRTILWPATLVIHTPIWLLCGLLVSMDWFVKCIPDKLDREKRAELKATKALEDKKRKEMLSAPPEFSGLLTEAEWAERAKMVKGS